MFLYLRFLKIVIFKISLRLRKEENVLFNETSQHILLTIIWRRTYCKGPFK